MDDRPAPPLSYLLECSQNSLHNFRLAKLTKSANTRKELKRLLDDWIEERALALLADWLLEYGAEMLASPVAQPETTEVKSNEKPQPLTAMPYEFWRSRARHFRRKAG